MSTETNAGCEVPRRWYHPIYWKVRQKSWWFFQPIFWWIYKRVAHCNGPEYFKAHPKLVRWTGGLKEFCWTFVCGHHFGFSLHMGNIYWKLWPRKSDRPGDPGK